MHLCIPEATASEAVGWVENRENIFAKTIQPAKDKTQRFGTDESVTGHAGGCFIQRSTAIIEGCGTDKSVPYELVGGFVG